MQFGALPVTVSVMVAALPAGQTPGLAEHVLVELFAVLVMPPLKVIVPEVAVPLTVHLNVVGPGFAWHETVSFIVPV